MQRDEAVAVVQAWQEAVNAQDHERLLALSHPEIEIVGPRGTAHGHQILLEWLDRAGLRLTTLRLFARDGTVVAAQRGVWRSPETGTAMGGAEIASWFRVEGGKVVQYARFDQLTDALAAAGLTEVDEHVLT
jgi:hypothetical protein